MAGSLRVRGSGTSVSAARNWEIDESDFGALIVFHKHRTETVTAYLWTDDAGVTEAECSLCGRTLRIEPPTAGSVMELPVDRRLMR